MPRYSFGPFLLDLESRALLRAGQRLPLAGRTLDTLAILVQNRGRLLDKDELLSLIWPGTIVDEANLSQSIFTLRKVLGDSRKDPRYIATIAGRGYQFVAPVTELAPDTSQSPDIPDKPRPEADVSHAIADIRTKWRPYAIVAGIAAVLAAAGVFWFALHQPANAPSGLAERRLTFNSAASEIASAVISPDGRYLAYSDPAGIHVRLLSTGEERLIPATAVAPVGASSQVDSWFPDGTQLLGHSREAGGHGTLWAVSIMGQSARELRRDAWGWGVSPDGTQIAFSPMTADAYRPEIWMMNDRGESPQKVLGLPDGEFLWSVRWSPDGLHLAYIRTQSPRNSLESCDLKGANVRQLVVSPAFVQWVRSFWWLPAGRIIYSQAEAADVEANLWQIRVDNRAGIPIGKPKRITGWAGVDVQGLSASADGTRLVLRKEAFPSQIYIGELEPEARRVRPPRNLTNDEAVAWATAWTPDGKAVLFTSNRGGKWGVYKQRIAESTALPLIEGRESANLARLSPDGSWILYSERSSKAGDRSHGLRLMRLAINGGPPTKVYEGAGTQLQDYPCARSGNRCVTIEASLDNRRLLIAAFDPLQGKGELLRTVEKDRDAGFSWALSPDGSVLAIARGDQPSIHIRLLSLTGDADRQIDVKGWPSASSMEWSPDGKGLYCGSVTSNSGTLLYVDLKGAAQVVARSGEIGGGSFIAGVPSPDGRYLALTGALHYSNAWLIENF